MSKLYQLIYFLEQDELEELTKIVEHRVAELYNEGQEGIALAEKLSGLLEELRDKLTTI